MDAGIVPLSDSLLAASLSGREPFKAAQFSNSISVRRRLFGPGPL